MTEYRTRLSVRTPGSLISNPSDKKDIQYVRLIGVTVSLVGLTTMPKASMSRFCYFTETHKMAHI